MRFFSHLMGGALLAAASATAMGQIATPSVISGIDTAGNLPLEVYDIGSGDFISPSPIPNGVVRTVGLAYDQMTQTLYISGRNGTHTPLYTLNLALGGTPALVAEYNGNLVNGTTGGLAWDPINNRLIASMIRTLYTVNPATAGTATLRDVGAISGPALKGMDFDPITGDLYIVNTSSTVSLPMKGAGIYRLNAPIESGSIVKLAPLPLRSGSPDTEVEGVAVGAGYVWLSTERQDVLYRLKLSDLSYDTPIAFPTIPATGVSGGATFVGTILPGPDVGIALRNTAETTVFPAGKAGVTVILRNLGNQAATSVHASVPVPAGAAFDSATGGAMLIGSTVEFNAGDLGAGQMTSFDVVFSAAESFTATANTTTTAADVYSGNNSASMSSSIGGADLVVSAVAPADCTAVFGQPSTFVVTVRNVGGSAANALVTAPLSAEASFDSSSPPGTVAMGVISIPAGTVAAGSSTMVNINLIPGQSTVLRITVTASTPGEIDLSDNSASVGTTTLLWTSAPIRALLATNAASGAIPGMVGTLSAGRTIDSIRSANGQWLMTRWAGSVNTQDDVLLRTSLPSGATTVIAQEGTTVLPNGQMPVADSYTGVCINNAGDFVFSGRAASALDYITKSIGGVSSMVAFEGDPAPAITGGTTYGAAFSSAQISESGVISYIANFNGLTSATDEFALTQNNSVVIYQDGSTVPGTGGPQTDIQNVGFYVSADGTRYLYEGRSNIGGTKTTAVVGTVGGTDGTAVVIQGTTLPGLSSPAAAIPLDGGTVMTPEGRWFVRGTNDDGDDWVLSGLGNTVGAANVLLHTGPTGSPATPITPGSSERWDPGTTSVMGLWANTSNPRGDILIAGDTTGDARANFVFVLNGTTVLAREGDPVDANNDGLFNDDVYLRGLQARDTVVLTDEAMYAVVTLRDRTGACSNAATTFATALIRVPIPQSNVVCCRGATCATVASAAACTHPAGTAGAAVGAGATCNTPGNSSTPCCYANYNQINGVSVQDIFDFLSDWFGGSPYAKVGGDGSPATLQVQDIFSFLSAWFGGC